MPTTQFSKPTVIAFVEGMMERLFVNNNFSYIHLIPVENGASWTAESLANQISSKFYVLNSDPDLIVVWLDKEEETRSSTEVCDKIRTALAARGANPQKIHICVPDLMTENVILADEVAIKDALNLDSYSYSFEGKNGKAELKRLFSASKKSYSETFDGVVLLKKIRLSRAATKSPSAAQFISAFPMDCWWI